MSNAVVAGLRTTGIGAGGDGIWSVSGDVLMLLAFELGDERRGQASNGRLALPTEPRQRGTMVLTTRRSPRPTADQVCRLRVPTDLGVERMLSRRAAIGYVATTAV